MSEQVAATAPVTADREESRGFGLPAAIALIMGSIIGVGIFNLPTSLASYGPITLVSMGLTTLGALVLAVLFGSLSRRLPADGGPYAYARVGFGNPLGFMNAWSYWITAWAGNAAIAVGWVLYVEHFVNKDHAKWASILLVLVGLWLPAFVNLSGAKNMASIQVLTTILKFAALLFMSTVGLFFIDGSNYTPWSVSTESTVAAIGSGMAIALFSYIGVECASVAAGKVRDPDRNVGRATLLGTLATAAVYMLSLVAIFGILSNGELQSTSEPFSAAANVIFGGTWAGDVMAILVIVSGLGALNGWTMICAEMPLAAANDGLFPERFKRLNGAGAPAFGIVSSTALASLAMVLNYAGTGGANAFTTLVLMTGITAAIPYLFSALAQLKWRWIDRKQGDGARFLRDSIVAVLAIVFSILFIVYSRNTGAQGQRSLGEIFNHDWGSWAEWMPFVLAGVALILGVPVYKAQRRHMTEPGDVPPYR
jgi:APA family basic amino acid/polyamine antiporter